MKHRHVHRRGLSAPEGALRAAEGMRRPHGGPVASGSLEREGPGRRPNPSLCGGAAVPLGRSLWPRRGSTPRSRQVRAMHRRAAGSQRPVRAIRAVKFEQHGSHLERTKLVWRRGSEVSSRPRGRRGELGNRRVGWKGGFARLSREARRWAPFVHSPSASRSVRRRHLALCRRHAHSVTDPNLVKKCGANLSSLSSWLRVSLQGRSTAHPLRGSISPASVFPCIGTGRVTIWACVVRPGSLQATAELRRCRAGPCGKLVGEVRAWAPKRRPWEGLRRSGKGPARSRGLKRGVSHPFAMPNGTAPFAATPTVLNLVGEPFSLRALASLRGTRASWQWLNPKGARDTAPGKQKSPFQGKKEPSPETGEGLEF